MDSWKITYTAVVNQLPPRLYVAFVVRVPSKLVGGGMKPSGTFLAMVEMRVVFDTVLIIWMTTTVPVLDVW